MSPPDYAHSIHCGRGVAGVMASHVSCRAPDVNSFVPGVVS
jgi:hypothetical protein